MWANFVTVLIILSISERFAQVSSPLESNSTATTSAAAASTPDASTQAKRAKEDANRIQGSVSGAAQLLDQADRYQKAIAAVTGPTIRLRIPNRSKE
jgi:hypothetical protein